MNTYIITEKQNLQSFRKGFEYRGTLRGAKLKASREQMFQGTVMTISEKCGQLVAHKDANGWRDEHDA